jgi:hypothetical protein
MDTGDDTQRMLNRQAAVLSQQAAPKAATGAPSPVAPVPMIVQAMQNGGVPVAPQAQASGGSFLPADAEQEIAQAQMDPRSIVPAADPYANTSNAAGVAFQNQLAEQDSGGNFNKFVRAADLVGKGLMAAGSSDPAKTLAMFQEQDAERNRTKVTPLADGAFSMVQEPGKPARIVRNDQVAQYLGDKQQRQFEQALQKVILGGQVQANTAADKAAIKTGEEARPILNDVNSLMDRWNQAKEIVSGQGTMAQVQGAFPTIAGFFGGDQVAANKFLEGLTVDETLLNTARTKGAISNQEMTLFKAPIPSLTDDREKVWKPWIEKRLEVLGKLKTFAEGEVARGAAAGGGGSSMPPAPTPAPSSSGGMTVPGLSPNASKYFK